VSLGPALLSETLVTVAMDAAAVANVCDHVEHNESADLAEVRMAGYRLRAAALRLAEQAGADPVELYRTRLRQIERRNVLYEDGVSYDGATAVPASPSWRQLQLAQVEHDRVYHPDVLGLSKLEQLRHYALHVAKLAGAVAATIAGEVPEPDLLARRVPDMFIFGIKLSTVVGERLPTDLVLQARSGSLGASANLA
jgi:hypothetical protein